MKKAICIVLVVIVLLIANALPGYAERHGHGGHGGHFSFRGSAWIGPGWGGWGPWWWGSPAYPYYYPYYYSDPYSEPPAVMQEEPSAYVQPTPHTEEQYYWYFCPDSRNYYPYVKTCPSGWLKVVPPQAPPDWKE